jgi:hypothetical protein
MINNRQHSRYPIAVSIKISHESIDEIILETKNVSDGGLFVVVSPDEMPPIGAIVKGQVQGMAEDSPIIEMKIVRQAEDGIGFQYINI